MGAKKETTGYDRPVTLEGTAWTWQTGQHKWIWVDRRGLNTAVTIDGVEYPVCLSKSLAEAGRFAEGFEAGWYAKARIEVVADKRKDGTSA